MQFTGASRFSVTEQNITPTDDELVMGSKPSPASRRLFSVDMAPKRCKLFVEFMRVGVCFRTQFASLSATYLPRSP